MKALVKVFAALVALFVLAIAGLAAYMTYLFDPNEYRSQIEQQAKEEAGIELKINGDIGWSIYPWLAIDVSDISARYPNQPELAKLTSASAALNIPALLGGSVEVDRVLVDGLALNLVSDKKGMTNWDSGKKPASKAEQSSENEALDTPTMALAIAGVELRNAQISFVDQAANQTVKLNGLNLIISQLELGKAVPIQFKTRLSVSADGKESLSVPIDMDTKLTLNLEAQTLQVSDLTLKLDETTLQGSGLYNLAKPQVSLNLKGDTLNLDNYMGSSEAATSAQSAKSTRSAKGWSKDPILPPLPLGVIDADIALSFDKVIIQSQEITDITLNAAAKGGVLMVSKLDANAFGGSLNSTAKIDARKKSPVMSFSPKLNNIKAEQLMAIAMEDPVLSANINLTADLQTSGVSIYDFVNNLNGTLNVNAAEGVIKGIDMAQQLCQKIENITALGFNPDQVDMTTPIAGLNSDYTIKNGVVSNSALNASVDAANLDAKGVIDLPKQAFDYNLGLTITEDLFKKSCGINPALRGTRIPVDCKGNFDTDPAKLCKLDTSFVGELIKKAAGKKVQAEIDKKKAELEQQATEKLQETLKDQMGDKLKGLFGK